MKSNSERTVPLASCLLLGPICLQPDSHLAALTSRAPEHDQRMHEPRLGKPLMGGP